MKRHKDSDITLKWQETAPELHGAEAAAAITEAFVRLLSSREGMAPVCDRSGDVGSRHYWPDGATVGDWCRCGKRRKFLP